MEHQQPGDAQWLPSLSGIASLSTETLPVFLDAMPVPLAWFRMDSGEAVLLNRAFSDTFGYTMSNIATWGHWSARFLDPMQRRQVITQWHTQTRRRNHDEAQAGLRVEQMELALLASDGRELTVLHSGVVLPALNCALAICVDITARKQNELRLAEAERSAREREVLYPVLLDLTREMIVLTGVDGVRQFVSPAVLPLTGWTSDEYLEMRVDTLLHPEDLPAVEAARERCLQGAVGEHVQYRTRKKDGSYLWVEATASCYRHQETGESLGYVATIRDASARQAEAARRADREAVLEQQARFDQLTGVANRHVFYTALSEEAKRQTRRTQELALLLIDVDYFKLYNDRYGHLEGDRILRYVADLLKEAASRVADLLARFGGEEFVLLLPMTDAAGAAAIAHRIVAAFANAAIPHADSPFGYVTVSVGVACWPDSAPLDRDELLLFADKALYVAKKEGRNRVAVRSCTVSGDADIAATAAVSSLLSPL